MNVYKDLCTVTQLNTNIPVLRTTSRLDCNTLCIIKSKLSNLLNMQGFFSGFESGGACLLSAGGHMCSVEYSDRAQLRLRNSVLSVQTAITMFFWFPVTGLQFQLWYEHCLCVNRVASHTNKCAAEHVTTECDRGFPVGTCTQLWFWSRHLSGLSIVSW